MNRADITELHFITAISNVPSILGHGILSHVRADQLDHDSVAMQEIQEIRANKQIPGAGCLHEYANLYFDAHNPMLSKCRNRNNEICVLVISHTVLELQGVIVSTQNASSDYTSFWPVNDGLARIDQERVYARYWTQGDYYDRIRHKSEKCAEVLVPGCVEPRFIIGAYVANQVAFDAFQALNSGLTVSIRGNMFF